MASVEPDLENPANWYINIDQLDAYANQTLDTKDLTYSLIHDYAHVLTLGSTQVTPDLELLTADENEFGDIAFRKEQACPNFFLQEGCTRTNSYINLYYQAFWTDLYNELEEINYIEDESEYYDALDAFYLENKSQFVTDYAATNPGEDIAESFTAICTQGETNR